jgi:hypothetical protein
MIFDMIQQLAGLLDYLAKGHRHATILAKTALLWSEPQLRSIGS